MIIPILALSLLTTSISSASAAAVHPRQAVKNGYHKNTQLISRQSTQPQCGDANGNLVDTAQLVNDAVSAGLPTALDGGRVSMTVNVANSDGCGPYSCYVSKDATGQFFDTLSISIQVPDSTSTCGKIGKPASYSLVAQLPDDIECTGPGGSCLILCKNGRVPTGTCVAFLPHGRPTSSQVESSPEQSATGPLAPASSMTSAPPASSSSSAEDTASPRTILVTSIVDSTRTSLITSTALATSLTRARVAASASSSLATSSTGTAGGAPTIIAFSGENGPGSLTEQQYGGNAALLNLSGSNGGGVGVPLGGIVGANASGAEKAIVLWSQGKGRAAAALISALALSACL